MAILFRDCGRRNNCYQDRNIEHKNHIDILANKKGSTFHNSM